MSSMWAVVATPARRMAGVLAIAALATGLGHAADEETCVTCHEQATPGIVLQWRSSEHAKVGVQCSQCHAAKAGEPDAFDHYGETVAIIVSPQDCGQCHAREFAEQKGSHHAKAGEILGSLDNLLGEVVGGEPAVNVGCRQCHGSIVKVDAKGQPTPGTWPNTGMGRINPDGSRGSCSACHARHAFSVRQARQPEACGKCHLGPDHPQMEVWEESKHGIMYRATREELKLDADPWRAGKEYFVGPTCASCHMSAAGEQPVTHDVGERISWTLRPAISAKLNLIVLENGAQVDVLGDDPQLPKVGDSYTPPGKEAQKVRAVLNWQARRERMQDVCRQCHAVPFVQQAYAQFDEAVILYNEKFAKPGKALIDDLRKAGKITPVDFDDPIEWTWYELWHHEGRRARHGAAMQGPDYAWWHGIYDVAKTFYQHLLPQVREVAGPELADELLKRDVYTVPGHEWHRDGMSKDALEKMQQFYRERYGQ